MLMPGSSIRRHFGAGSRFLSIEAAEAQDRYPRVYGEGLVAEMAAAALPRYWPTPLLTPMCQTLAACACLLSQEPLEQCVLALHQYAGLEDHAPRINGMLSLEVCM